MIETETNIRSSQLRIRRSGERALQDLGWSKNWLTFSFADYHDPDWMGFGPLRVLIESHIDPHSGFPEHPHRNVEILSYITGSALRHRDSFGHETTLTEGDMQLISAGRRGMMHSEKNPFDEREQHYQIWLRPDRTDTDFDYHERGYTAEERQGQFRLYASPNGLEDSMPLNTDAYVSVGRFAPGDTVTHDVQAGRGAWIQVVHGTVQVEGVVLETGDGLGTTREGPVHFGFGTHSEVLLIDVQMEAEPDRARAA